ncbi:MAG: GNAT family N-acetyltransferase [Candidatus ainarchaeum sp.]|nr:GNAT family N-acetyltransferase [Candidatus ainarchaeum sp.]
MGGDFVDKLTIKKAKKSESTKYNNLEKIIFKDSYYTKINYTLTHSKITEKDYFINYNSKTIGTLSIGNSIEFGGKFGIGIVGLKKEFRNKGIGKKVIILCKKFAKKEKETQIFLSVPLLDNETISIFEKLGFKKHHIETNIQYKDGTKFLRCRNDQLKHLILTTNDYKKLGWQIMCSEV